VELEYLAEDPYTIWLRTLFLGAAVAALGSFVAGGWTYAQLMGRVQGFPGRRSLEAAFGYAMLGSAAINWMGTWLLTSPSPLYDPANDRAMTGRIFKLRAGLLRLFATGLFLIWSLRLFGVLGLSPRPSYNDLGFWCIAQSCEALAIIVLWFHLRALAARLRLRGLQVRAVIVLIGRGGAVLLLGVAPTLSAVLNGTPLHLSWDFVNLRNAIFVLWSCISMLVLIRFALAFRNAAAQES
jgi:hypothetical protein